MRTQVASFMLWAGSGLALAGGLFLSATPRGRVEGGPEVEATRFNINPSYAVGEKFRVERTFRQNTLTAAPQGAIGGRRGGVDPLAYDASLTIDALVTIEKVDAKGAAAEWTAKFDKLRVDIPDPIQTQEYRMRERERKQKRLTPNAHPLEGMTLKVEQKPDGKARLFRVLKNGEDAGISQRYPEVTPLMQSLVDPDWTANEGHTIGGEWEMPADQIYRLTKVLAKTPLEGKIKCRLDSVVDGIANIEFTAVLAEVYATVEMKISVEGRIEFDTKRSHVIGSKYKGEVAISVKGSSTKGIGTVSGGSSYTDAVGTTDSDADTDGDKDKPDEKDKPKDTPKDK